jgi:hypothetical protein
LIKVSILTDRVGDLIAGSLKDKEKEILPCTRRGGVETSDRWIKRKLRSY